MKELFLETGTAQLAKKNEELCGDRVEILKGTERTILVLSDGLGSGVKANILATLTSKIIVHMLKEGARLVDVVETISGTLPTCQERQLAYATFTIIEITGFNQARIVEFENPPTIICRQGQLLDWPRQERLIADKKLLVGKVTLEPGDLLVAVSDGAIHAGVGAVLNMGWQWTHVAEYVRRLAAQKLSAKEVAQWLAMVCNQLYGQKPGDDTSVLACCLRKLRRTTVLVGPPQERSKDAEVARLLRAQTGRKVICGGTTSQIVAREWDTQLTVSLPSEEADLPPTAQLPGVDLVTEGVLTLNKTLDLLQQREERSTAKGNAALSLQSLLLASDHVHFMVGHARNPAHQNPGFPTAFKPKLVAEIARELNSRGITVTQSNY